MPATDKSPTDVSKVVADTTENDNLATPQEVRQKVGELDNSMSKNDQQEAFRVLIDMWGDDQDNVRQNAAENLRTIWANSWISRRQVVLDQVIETLKRNENADDWEVRKVAADWLAENALQIAENDKIVEQALTELIKTAKDDDDPVVRKSAWEASKKIWEAGLEVDQTHETQRLAVFGRFLKALREDDDEDDWKVRQAAASWLGENALNIVEDDRMTAQALDALNKSAKDKDEDLVVRRAALKASKKIWDQGWNTRRQRVLDKVLIVLTDDDDDDDYDWEVRKAAADWLAKKAQSIITDERMMKQTVDALANRVEKDSDDYVKGGALAAIRNIWGERLTDTSQGIHILNEVLDVLKDDNYDYRVRQTAAGWLGENAQAIAADNKMVTQTLKVLTASIQDNNDDDIKQSARKASREIWETAWNSEDSEGSYRLAILNQVLKALKTEDGRDNWELRQTAADWLGDKAEDIAKDDQMLIQTFNALVERPKEDNDSDVKQTATQACKKIWDASWNIQKNRSTHRLATINQVLKAIEEWDKWEFRQVATNWLGEKAEDIAKDDHILIQALNALVKRVKEDDDADVKQTAAQACRKIWDASWDIQENQETHRLATINQVLQAIEEWDDQFRQIAINWLGEKAKDIVTDDQMINQALNALSKRIKTGQDYGVRQSAGETSRKIWDAGWRTGDTNTHRSVILNQVLKALAESDDFEFRHMALNWLADKTEDIAGSQKYEMTEETAKALDLIKKHETEADELREIATRSLKSLWDTLQKNHSLENFKEQFEKQDEQEKIETVRKLANVNTFGSREAVNFLVEAWVQWIFEGNNPRLVVITAEALRHNEHAVLPLVEQFVKNWDEPENQETTGPGRSVLLALSSTALQEQQEKERLKKEIRAAKALRTRRQIARELASMSDPRFFDMAEEAHLYDDIIHELREHAVPALIYRLPLEDDIDILDNVVRTLVYTRERAAVEAIMKEIVGEDRARQSRKDLLAQYYLKPSKDRSDQAADILEKAIKESKRTLRLLQILNIAVFVVGLSMLFVGLLMSMLGDNTVTRVVGGLSAAGGLTGILIQLVRDPLNRIQNANANLVQMETAFTSFIWELNLNGTFIQSSYVDNGELTDKEIDTTVGRIENAMELTMNLISMYTEEGGHRLVTRVNTLEPAAGKTGSSISIHGQHLLGDITNKKGNQGLVAVNHSPINDSNITWTPHEVKFKLPETINGNTPGETIWISLYVDGMETNALPFQVVQEAG